MSFGFSYLFFGVKEMEIHQFQLLFAFLSQEVLLKAHSKVTEL